MGVFKIYNCPYCQKYRVDLCIKYVDNRVEEYLSGYRVKCMGCGLQGPIKETRDKAVDAWNTIAGFSTDLKGVER